MHLRPRSRLRAPSLVTFLFSALSMDCANGAIDTGGASLSGDSATVDSGSAPHDSAPVSHDAAHDSLGGVDDATIVSATFPDHLACDGTNVTTVVVKNTGTTTWTKAAGYKLGGVGDSDPLHPGEARIWLGDTDVVAPGATYTFGLPLTAPHVAGTYTTHWRMVHELVDWFGATATRDIVVDCAPTDAGVDSGPTTIDLSTAVVENSPPDVASWPETAKITTFDMNTDGVFVDFTKRDGAGSWPDVPFGDGGSLEYTLWIVIDVGGTWYTSGCIQFWRDPSHVLRNGGPPSGYASNWYYDSIRWGPMVGHQPVPGETVGFFVTAGNERNVKDDSCCAVKERSNVIVISFPADPGAVFTY